MAPKKAVPKGKAKAKAKAKSLPMYDSDGEPMDPWAQLSNEPGTPVSDAEVGDPCKPEPKAKAKAKAKAKEKAKALARAKAKQKSLGATLKKRAAQKAQKESKTVSEEPAPKKRAKLTVTLSKDPKKYTVEDIAQRFHHKDRNEKEQVFAAIFEEGHYDIPFMVKVMDLAFDKKEKQILWNNLATRIKQAENNTVRENWEKLKSLGYYQGKRAKKNSVLCATLAMPNNWQENLAVELKKVVETKSSVETKQRFYEGELKRIHGKKEFNWMVEKGKLVPESDSDGDICYVKKTVARKKETSKIDEGRIHRDRKVDEQERENISSAMRRWPYTGGANTPRGLVRLMSPSECREAGLVPGDSAPKKTEKASSSNKRKATQISISSNDSESEATRDPAEERALQEAETTMKVDVCNP